MREIYDDLLEEIDGGSMWEPYTQTIKRLGGKAVGGVKKRLQAKSAAS